MAGQLIQVATNTVTSAVASVTLTGIDSDDVYMVAINDFTPATDNVSVSLKFTVSGTAEGTSESYQAIYYLYNFNNASEYSFCTIEVSARDLNGNLLGGQGGGVLTVAQATDGIQLKATSGNITSGTFTLYRVI